MAQRDQQSPVPSDRVLADVVIVSYRSRAELRQAVEPIVSEPDFHVIVVDNASPDASLEVVSDLDVTSLQLPRNGGFAYGCNAGWRLGNAPHILFLNPDARIAPSSLRRLVAALDGDDRIGVVAPRIEDEDGSLAFSLRNFPRLRSTYARAFFLHRVFPEASWADDVIRDPTVYRSRHAVDWASGACLLVRRSLLEQIDGLDEGFFMYGEDIDLCRRAWSAGSSVRYEPGVVVRHAGGRSAPRTALLPALAASQLRYARKHGSGLFPPLQRFGLVLGSVTHLLVGRGGRPARAGRLRALGVLAGRKPPVN